MALDGAFLRALSRELGEKLIDARVDKIHQPQKEELVFCLRGKSGVQKLLFSVRVQSPRVHLTENVPENPASPPMFCMLLRKHLQGAKLVAVRQTGFERALFFDFATRNEMGDPVTLTLACEMMGRNSNLVLFNADTKKIVDAVRRVDFETSESRPILPGTTYLPPPTMAGKLDVGEASADTVVSRLKTGADGALCDTLLAATQGLSPLLCREAAKVSTGAPDTPVSLLTDEQWQKLAAYLEKVRDVALCGAPRPYLLYKPDGAPLEFSFLPVTQYGLSASGRELPSLSALLDAFYAEKDEAERLRAASRDLTKLLNQNRERVTRKIARQREELLASEKREQKRLFGDLINANLGVIPKGASSAEVVNYYDEACGTIIIPLDPAKTPAQNAQKYYKDYRKAQTAAVVLQEQIAAGEEEQLYLETVADALSRAGSVREIAELRQELASGGYIRLPRGKQKAPAALPPMEFVSSDGFTIYVGRNNRQNDLLTLKTARGRDTWLHVKNIPGSHVIIVCNGQPLPDRTVTEAATLSAFYSKAQNSAQVPVDFTEVRHVRKPAGAKPGRVIYDHQQTVYVTPDEKIVAKLQKTP